MTRVRGVLQADAATILLADEDGRLSVAASSVPGASEDEEQERPEPIVLGEGFAGRVAQAREAMLAQRPRARRPAGPGARRGSRSTR